MVEGLMPPKYMKNNIEIKTCLFVFLFFFTLKMVKTIH